MQQEPPKSDLRKPPFAGLGENAVPLDVTSPISALITRHIFNNGEVVELLMRPSAWWIIFTSWRSLLVGAVIIVAGITFADRLPGSASWYVEVGALIGLIRLMWATVRWMSRIHMLTNMRVLTISGVFNVSVLECPLRRLARVRDVSQKRERLLLLGSLELIPIDESFAISTWQTIRRPAEVLRKIRTAIEKSHTPPA